MTPDLPPPCQAPGGLEADLHAATVRFWNAHPCDAQADYPARARYRYAKEPWLIPLLAEIGHYPVVLEVGCGQGTDAITCCRQMVPGSAYRGLDASAVSLGHARRAAEENAGLIVRPEFMEGRAESLPFSSDSQPCVVSIGVLHHVPDETVALRELWRVLTPGGMAFIALYRAESPKLIVAQSLRVLAGLPVMKRFRARAGRGGSAGSRVSGTMLAECWSSPLLKAYTRAGICRLFKGWNIRSLDPVGVGIPWLGRLFDRDGINVLGSYWLIRAQKSEVNQ